MALTKCPECKKEISSKAKACPNCGYEMKSKGGGCLWTIGMAIAIFILFSIFSYYLNEGDTDTVTYSKSLAYNYAEDFVKEKLKSPSTAKFPGLLDRDKHIAKTSEGVYKIYSWVESQNSFGATIRTRFSCTIRFEGSSVYCDNLEFVE